MNCNGCYKLPLFASVQDSSYICISVSLSRQLFCKFSWVSLNACFIVENTLSTLAEFICWEANRDANCPQVGSSVLWLQKKGRIDSISNRLALMSFASAQNTGSSSFKCCSKIGDSLLLTSFNWVSLSIALVMVLSLSILLDCTQVLTASFEGKAVQVLDQTLSKKN